MLSRAPAAKVAALTQRPLSDQALEAAKTVSRLPEDKQQEILAFARQLLADWQRNPDEARF